MNDNELMHYGVPGMRWGHRKAINRVSTSGKKTNKSIDKNQPEYRAKVAKRKKALKIGTAVVGTALATYGAYKVSKLLKDKAAAKSIETGRKMASKYFAAAQMARDDLSKGSAYVTNSNAYLDTLRRTERRTDKVRNSTIQAIKYLRDPSKFKVTGF